MPRPAPCVPRSALALLLASVLLAAPVGAWAKDLNGRLAVGLEQTLAGATGLAVRYFVSEGVGLTTTLGVDLTLVDDDDGQSHLATGIVGSFGLLAHFARSLHAHLGLGLRATLGWRSLEAAQFVDPAATTTDLQFALEAPLVLEFYLSDHFSVGVATGVLINFVPKSGAVLPSSGAGGTRAPGGVGIGIGAGSMSTLTVLYYF